MQAVVRSQLQRFRRRVHLATFAGGTSRALASLLLLAAGALLIARLLYGWQPAVRPAWLFLLLLPVSYGLWYARRVALPPLTRVAHLDQRLGLGGLLLARTETGAGGWDERLQRALQSAGDHMPTLHWSLLGRRVLWPGLLFAVVCWLPEAEPAPVANRSIAQALSDVQAALELARQEGVIPDEKLAELARRAEELLRGHENAKEAAWSDVDELRARLEQAEVMQRDALQKTAHAAKALQEAARNPGAQSPSGAAPDLDTQMRELLQHAAAAGLLGKLPQDVDPSQASHAGDAEAFDKLAAALAESVLEEVEAHPGMLGEGGEDLAELLRGMQPGGAGADIGGRGGVDRGPGHATLEFAEHFDGDTSALQAHKLPPGRVLPQDWEIMQTRRIEPEVAPTRNQGAGGEAAGGAGEAAWRRRLSPTHRAVVHEFFSSRHGDADKK
ncbi:MAG: hypothetical protein R3F56_09850 [Planctomycetota bacterium]